MLHPLSLGIITTLSNDPRQRLQTVQQVGLSHIQWSYQANLDKPSGRAAILGAARECELEITTVFCSYEGQSYADIPTVRATVGLVPIATRAQRLEKTREISLCAQNLGVSRIAMHLGFIPENPDDAAYAGLVETTRGLAEELAERGQTLAFETGQETAQTLRRFLLDVNCPNLRVNFDPANMILYGNDNLLQAMPLVAQWMDEVHCKDARWPIEKGQSERLVKDGFTPAGTQRVRCRGCGKRSTPEAKPRGASAEKQAMVLAALGERISLHLAARTFGMSRDTISVLLEKKTF